MSGQETRKIAIFTVKAQFHAAIAWIQSSSAVITFRLDKSIVSAKHV
jgi:hypothetical protein